MHLAALLAAQCALGASMGVRAMVFSDFNPLGPKLKAQTPPKYALTAPTTSTQGYAVREKMLSISGEDFYVEREGGGRAFDIVGSNKVPFGVGGFVLDKMELKADGKLCGSIERRAVAMATAYDIYLKGECIAKIEKDIVSLTPSYKFFYEAENNGNPCYRATGSFSQRKYDIYARDGSEVATIGRQLLELMPDRADTYHVKCAAGVDPAAIVALCLVIDEDHDESDAARDASRKESSGGDDGGGMFGFFKGPLG